MAFQGFQVGAFQSGAFQGAGEAANNDTAGDAAWPWEIAEALKRHKRHQDERDERWAARKKAILRANRRLRGIVDDLAAETPVESEPVKVAAKTAAKVITKAAQHFIAPPPSMDLEAIGREISAASKAVAAAEAILAHYQFTQKLAQSAAAEQARLLQEQAIAAEKSRLAQAAAEAAIAQVYAEEEAHRIAEEALDLDDEEVMLLLAA